MAGLIPQQFIDELLNRVDILEVIDSRVKLRKAGKNYSGLCPFHNEKSPSFSVQPDKQFYHCFGCGVGGNALGFLMAYENIDFPDAVEELARLAGVEVPREETKATKATKSRYDTTLELLAKVNKWYVQQLKLHPARERAVSYLKKRGITGEIARDFNLGYAPPGWENVMGEFGSTPEAVKLLEEAGLVIGRDKNTSNNRHSHYDRFRDRIIYPIRDVRGRVIGFGGRVLGDEKPKYLNSPETQVFRKGEELYGLYEAKQQRRQFERYLLVEGYMDVIALAQNSIYNSVATLGTATSEKHLRTLFKQTSEIVFCFDGDNAGREAAWRALQVALPLMEDGRSLRFLFLPDGQDPDTHVRTIGRQAFEAQIAQATRLADFLFSTLSSKLDMDSPEGKAQLASAAKPLLQKLPEGVFSKLMLDELGRLTGVSRYDLLASPPANLTNSPAYIEKPNTLSRNSLPQQSKRNSRPQTISVAMRMVNLLIRQPSILREVELPEDFQQYQTRDLLLLLKVIEIARSSPDASPHELMGRLYSTDYSEQLTQVLSRELITPKEGFAHEFKELLTGLTQQQQQLKLKAATLQKLHTHFQSEPTNELPPLDVPPLEQ
jgi:DNA primase